MPPCRRPGSSLVVVLALAGVVASGCARRFVERPAGLAGAGVTGTPLAMASDDFRYATDLEFPGAHVLKPWWTIDRDREMDGRTARTKRWRFRLAFDGGQTIRAACEVGVFEGMFTAEAHLAKQIMRGNPAGMAEAGNTTRAVCTYRIAGRPVGSFRIHVRGPGKPGGLLVWRGMQVPIRVISNPRGFVGWLTTSWENGHVYSHGGKDIALLECDGNPVQSAGHPPLLWMGPGLTAALRPGVFAAAASALLMDDPKKW